MTTYTAQIPFIYGLPKIHKPNLPLRPITSSTKVPCYELSKYIGNILQCVTKNSTYAVKNSLEFIDKAKDVILGEQDILVSFDAISLFTNIPTQVVTTIVKKKWNIISESSNLSLKKFLELLDFCLKENNVLQYKNNLYKQIHGVPMGNPLSPTIADLVLDFLLEECFTSVKPPKLLVKYVDDIFAVIDYREVETVLLSLNNFNSKLQFTVEKEKNNAIAFLDVKIHRENYRLTFDWYQKDTASGRIINFQSNQPKHIIINTALNLLNKVFTISDEKFHTANKEKVTQILVDNGFPWEIIRSLFQRQNNTTRTKKLENKPGFFKSMVYVPKLAESFKKSVANNVKDVNIAYKSNQTLQSLFTRLTTNIKKDCCTDVVYKVNCLGNEEESCELCYIGTTKQLLKQRISNHKSDLKSKSSQKTALASHSIEKNHTPDFDNTKILQTEKNASKRYTLETLHILNNKNNMNRKQDTQNISSVYCSLVST